MPTGQNLVQLVTELQQCPGCGYLARRGHVNFCDGNVVLCDLCDEPTPIARSYHAVYFHYTRVHGGKKGKLLRKVPQGQKHEGKPKKPSDVITLELVIPFNDSSVRRTFSKYRATWLKLASQPITVFDTKDFEQFSLMAAVATFKLEYQ